MTELSSLIYVDANPFIYAIEGPDALASQIKELFACLRNRPGSAYTSELTLAEVLPKAPLPEHRRSYFNLIVWSGIFDLKPVTREVLVDTAEYRKVAATTRPDGSRVLPKLPDAIHVVTAAKAGCTSFLSADSGIKLPSNMKLIEPDAAGIANLLSGLS